MNQSAASLNYHSIYVSHPINYYYNELDYLCNSAGLALASDLLSRNQKQRVSRYRPSEPSNVQRCLLLLDGVVFHYDFEQPTELIRLSEACQSWLVHVISENAIHQ